MVWREGRTCSWRSPGTFLFRSRGAARGTALTKQRGERLAKLPRGQLRAQQAGRRHVVVVDQHVGAVAWLVRRLVAGMRREIALVDPAGDFFERAPLLRVAGQDAAAGLVLRDVDVDRKSASRRRKAADEHALDDQVIDAAKIE